MAKSGGGGGGAAVQINSSGVVSPAAVGAAGAAGVASVAGAATPPTFGGAGAAVSTAASIAAASVSAGAEGGGGGGGGGHASTEAAPLKGRVWKKKNSTITTLGGTFKTWLWVAEEVELKRPPSKPKADPAQKAALSRGALAARDRAGIKLVSGA